MATYFELLAAAETDDLRKRIKVSIIIAAESIRTAVAPLPANQTARLVWAKEAYADPESKVDQMMNAVLAQNKSQTYQAIVGASDTVVQAAVNAAVDVFAN